MKNGLLLLLFTVVFGGCKSHFKPLPANAVIDSIAVYKGKRQMLVYENRGLRKTYSIRLGDAPVGQKHFEGDEKTPEGCYTINTRNPYSGYHKNLGISYPTAAQKAYAKAQGKSAGGEVKIHARPNGTWVPEWVFDLDDWTNGCIAVSNEEVDELYRTVKPNCPICIFP